MTRVLLVAQDKGGVGKSIAVRAIAEAVPGVGLIEIDASQRLVEFDAGKPKAAPRQVRFFPMRAERAAIERTGGRAAREEFDAVIQALSEADVPSVVDIGANTSMTLLALLSELAPELNAAGTDFGVLVVTTAEPGALAEAPRLLALAKPWAAARFLMENRMRGQVDAKHLALIADGATISTFEEQIMDAAAVELLQARGLIDVPRLVPAQLTKLHGVAKGARIRGDLTRFRLEAMQAVRQAAQWLVG